MGINEYFESIKSNKAKLRQFIADMPKGGDLHNHLTGSAYAETYFEIACRDHLVVDMETGKLYDAGTNTNGNVIQLPPSDSDLHNVRNTLIDKWSIRNFQPYKYPLGPDEYFFSEFGVFAAATKTTDLPDILHELVVRAKEENLQYIEIMGISPSVGSSTAYLSAEDYEKYTKAIDDACNEYNANPSEKTAALDNAIKDVVGLYDKLFSDSGSALYSDINKYISDNKSIYNNGLSKTREFITSRYDTNVSYDDVTVRFQGYVSRSKEPLFVLAQLYIISKAMSSKEMANILVGCNIVAAENSENSMLYYKAHMRMFRYFISNGTISNVAMHAGELTMGLIRPEHLTYHISEAVNLTADEDNGKYIKRIGHGVDIVFEHDSKDIIQKMRDKNIAVEINLTSNEFILGVRDDSHPFRLYLDSGVPVVISTDDPGILRTSITDEYVKAIYRYNLSYSEVKNIVLNGIEYSFLDDATKNNVINNYNKALGEFEANFENVGMTNEIPLRGFKKGMFLHWDVTAHAGNANTVTLKDSAGNVYFNLNKSSSSATIMELGNGSSNVKADDLIITVANKCKYILSSSDIVSYDGGLKGITCTVTLEDLEKGDDDYNDFTIQLVAWTNGY